MRDVETLGILSEGGFENLQRSFAGKCQAGHVEQNLNIRVGTPDSRIRPRALPQLSRHNDPEYRDL